MNEQEALSKAEEGAKQIYCAFTERMYNERIAVHCFARANRLEDGAFEPIIKLLVEDTAMLERLECEFGEEIRREVSSFGKVIVATYEHEFDREGENQG